MITVAIAGAGQRGYSVYAKYAAAMPERAKIVAVADTDPEKVERCAKEYNIPAEGCFSSVEDMLAAGKLADVMFICTQDQQHVSNAIPALKLGYDILLEKPVSPDAQECRELLHTARECGRKVAVCHVLRYSPFYRKIKEVIDSGVLGKLWSIQSIENVCYWHQAHSFVRGNWRDSNTTSPMFLAKCCHDMDLMVWLTGQRCKRVSSFGSLSHFTSDHAPEGAAKRCLDGCAVKESCPYDAEKIYITDKETGVRHNLAGAAAKPMVMDLTEESVREAIRTGPYGRCVYFCDNNVVDHQTVNLEMEDGTTVSFLMCGFTAFGGRNTRYMGTHGSMVADLEAGILEVTPFGQETTTYHFQFAQNGMVGHGGGDELLLGQFFDYIEGKQPDGITSLEASLESHFISMAAEESRVHGGKVIDIELYRV